MPEFMTNLRAACLKLRGGVGTSKLLNPDLFRFMMMMMIIMMMMMMMRRAKYIRTNLKTRNILTYIVF